jgi:hypothetical protein
MTTKTGMSLYAYTSASGARNDYGARADKLSFSTIASGGFGHFSCRISASSMRVVPPELKIFANVALTDGAFWAFEGRWDQPAIKVNDTDGEYYELTAQGAAAALTDEPDDYSYTAQTMQAIIANQLSARAAYIPIDQDTSLIMPDAPGATYDRAFAGMDIAQILNQELPKLGSLYDWFVWDHARKDDAWGFPTWQLSVLLRDTTTIHYTGYVEDEVEASISQAVEWTYNGIELLYRDASSGVLTKLLVKDSRLNSDKSQGAAPYPFRKKRIDLSSTGALSATQATNQANALLAAYQNGGARDSIRVTRVYDNNGVEIPLHRVRSGRNIFLPQFSPTGYQFPFSATANTNLFYILETNWTDDAKDGRPELTLNMQTFDDSANVQLARLQEIATLQTQDHRVIFPAVQAPGAAWFTRWGFQGDVTTNGHTVGPQLPFLNQQSNAPASITFAQVFAPINVTVAPSTSNVDQFGASAWVSANAGQTNFAYTVKIAGNTLLDFDEPKGTVSHHCQSCEERWKRKHGCVGMACEECYAKAVRAELSVEKDLRIDHGRDYGRPGEIAIAIDCPCGVTECFTPNTYAHDEDENHPTNHAARANHVRVIRQVQRYLGHRIHDHCSDLDGCASCDAATPLETR